MVKPVEVKAMLPVPPHVVGLVTAPAVRVGAAGSATVLDVLFVAAQLLAGVIEKAAYTPAVKLFKLNAPLATVIPPLAGLPFFV